MVPDSCPQRTEGSLHLLGCGFYPTDKCIVKFTRLGQLGLQAPRSAPATVVSENELRCRPPRFSDPGDYSVAVAMNGTDFTTGMIKLKVFAEPVLHDLMPSVFDMRTLTTTSITLVTILWDMHIHLLLRIL